MKIIRFFWVLVGFFDVPARPVGQKQLAGGQQLFVNVAEWPIFGDNDFFLAEEDVEEDF